MPSTSMATFGTRLYTRLSSVWIKPTLHKGDASGNYGVRDMTRIVIQRNLSQTTDLLQFLDENGNVLSGVDNAGNKYISGVPTLKECATLVTISAANITDTGAGHLGNATGVVLVPDPAAGSLVELISCVMSYTYATAAYTGGGNITVNSDGGSALTGLISYASSIGAGASNITQFVPLSTAGNTLISAKGFNLVAAAAPTQPGTAAGTVKVYTRYRLYTSL